MPITTKHSYAEVKVKYNSFSRQEYKFLENNGMNFIDSCTINKFENWIIKTLFKIFKCKSIKHILTQVFFHELGSVARKQLLRKRKLISLNSILFVSFSY